MPIETKTSDYVLAMEALHDQIMVALDIKWIPVSLEEQLKFAKDHPGAHFVIGDFEIKCLNPEKYHL